MTKSIKTGGRQAGTPNKVTKEAREIIKSIVEDELNKLPEYFNKLEVIDRLHILCKLIPYVCPKLEPEDKNVNNIIPIIWNETHTYSNDEKPQETE